MNISVLISAMSPSCIWLSQADGEIIESTVTSAEKSKIKIEMLTYGKKVSVVSYMVLYIENHDMSM